MQKWLLKPGGVNRVLHSAAALREQYQRTRPFQPVCVGTGVALSSPMSVGEARKEFEAGRLPAERLLDLLERQERLIKHLQAEVERLQQRLAQYEPEAHGQATPRPADGP